MLFLKSKTIGNIGETKAVRYLRMKGYKILETNYYTKFGEIDIITQKDECICFIEVKTRQNDKFGEPRDAVNYYKQKKIISVAEYYMATLKHDYNCRFDVIEVKISDNKVKIEHIKNAFWS